MTTASSKTRNQSDPAATILLVTCSDTSAKLIGKQLRDRFELCIADDAERAWESLVEERGISLVICELNLAIDAFALLERLRGASDNRLAAVPVLLLVGENDTEHRRELALHKGATDFINLPFASSELIARVQLHTSLYRQHGLASEPGPDQVTAVNLLKQLAQESLFAARIEQELSFSQRHRSPMSLCKLRLDNLKAIVSEFDRPTAISVVQAVARIIQQAMRREDSLCYLGNAEFRVLFPATNGIGAIAGINRVLRQVEQRQVSIGGEQVRVTLSAAVYSCIADDDIDLKQIERQLDKSLRTAAAAGGNQVVGNSSSGEARAPSVDRALRLLAAGKSADLSGQVPALLGQLLPLLDLADEVLEADLEPIRSELRNKFGNKCN